MRVTFHRNFLRSFEQPVAPARPKPIPKTIDELHPSGFVAYRRTRISKRSMRLVDAYVGDMPVWMTLRPAGREPLRGRFRIVQAWVGDGWLDCTLEQLM